MVVLFMNLTTAVKGIFCRIAFDKMLYIIPHRYATVGIGIGTYNELILLFMMWVVKFAKCIQEQ